MMSTCHPLAAARCCGLHTGGDADGPDCISAAMAPVAMEIGVQRRDTQLQVRCDAQLSSLTHSLPAAKHVYAVHQNPQHSTLSLLPCHNVETEEAAGHTAVECTSSCD
jgi:hypothetical protein